MKIVIALLMTPGLHITGDFENAYLLYLNLKKQGHDVRFITPPLHKKIPGVEYYSSTFWDDKKALRLCPEFVQKINSIRHVDVIHVFYPSISLSFLNLFIHRKEKTKLITHFGNPLVDQSWSTLLRLDFKMYLPRVLSYNTLLFRLSKNASDCFVVSSQHQKNQLHALGVPHDKVAAIYNFVNFSKLQAKKKSEPYTFSTPVISYIGHFTPTKGVEHLIEAFYHIKKKYPNATLVLAWSGHGDKEKMVAEIKKYHLKDVMFLPEIDVGELVRASDVFVLPYLFTFGTHVFPSTLLEAFSVGTRVVTTDQPIFRELFTEEVAYLAKPRDTKSLTEKILAILTQDKKPFMLKQQALMKAFSEKKITEKYDALYERLFSHPKSTFYQRADIVRAYDHKRFGGKSGNFVHREEISPYLPYLENVQGKILDIPVGTGRLSKILVQKKKQVEGADLSDEMLTSTKAHLNIPLYKCNAKKTPFKENTYGAVVSIRFFQHFKTIEPFISEFKRITKPGGYVMFDVFGWSPQSLSASTTQKVYPHSIREILHIAQKLGLVLVKHESKFLLPPLILRNMPYPALKALQGLERIFPDSLKTRHFFIFKKR